ncbi:MAG: hypothetical protein OHK0046_44790 [Anaerolineae bacterium]
MRNLWILLLLLLLSSTLYAQTETQTQTETDGATITTYTGFMDDRQDDARYPVQLSAGDELTVRMIKLTGDLDPRVRLENPSGRVVLENDDLSNDDLSAGFTYQVESSGEFVVIASNIVNTGGDYELTVTVQSPLSQGMGEAPQGPLRTFSGYMDDELDDTRYPVMLEIGQTVSAVMVAQTDALDPLLYLEAPNGDVIVENDDLSRDNLDAFLTHTAEVPGEYTVIASNVRNTGGDFRLYVLTSDAEAQVYVGVLDDETPAIPQPLVLVRRQNLTAIMTRITGDLQPTLLLQDPEGTLLAENGGEFETALALRVRTDGDFILTAGRQAGSGLYLLTVEASEPIVPSDEVPDATYTGLMDDEQPEYTFPVTLTAGQSLIASASALSGDLDLYMVIRNSDGDVVAENDDATDDTLDPYMAYVPEVPGEYTIAVSNIYGTSGEFEFEFFLFSTEPESTAEAEQSE